MNHYSSNRFSVPSQTSSISGFNSNKSPFLLYIRYPRLTSLQIIPICQFLASLSISIVRQSGPPIIANLNRNIAHGCLKTLFTREILWQNVTKVISRIQNPAATVLSTVMKFSYCIFVALGMYSISSFQVLSSYFSKVWKSQRGMYRHMQSACCGFFIMFLADFRIYNLGLDLTHRLIHFFGSWPFDQPQFQRKNPQMKVSLSNQRLIRDYFASLECQTLKKLKASRSVLSPDSITSMVLEILNANHRKPQSNKENIMSKSNHSLRLLPPKHSQSKETALQYSVEDHCNEQSSLMSIFYSNQEKILDQQEHMGYIRRQREIEHEITKVFMKQWLNDPQSQRESGGNRFPWEGQQRTMRQQRPHSLSRSKKMVQSPYSSSSSRIEIPDERFINSIATQTEEDCALQLTKVPMSSIEITEFPLGEQQLKQRYKRTKCQSEREMLNSSRSRFVQSELSKAKSPDQKIKTMALNKLRKLETIVFKNSDNKISQRQK